MPTTGYKGNTPLGKYLHKTRTDNSNGQSMMEFCCAHNLNYKKAGNAEFQGVLADENMDLFAAAYSVPVAKLRELKAEGAKLVQQKRTRRKNRAQKKAQAAPVATAAVPVSIVPERGLPVPPNSPLPPANSSPVTMKHDLTALKRDGKGTTMSFLQFLCVIGPLSVEEARTLLKIEETLGNNKRLSGDTLKHLIFDMRL